MQVYAQDDDTLLIEAGASFIKSWRIENIGFAVWPESTELVFMGGDRMAAYEDAPLAYIVGRVEPGDSIFASAADLKVRNESQNKSRTDI